MNNKLQLSKLGIPSGTIVALVFMGGYIRNPPTSSHSPGSKLVCTIFVTLWQFNMDDRKPENLRIEGPQFTEDSNRAGVSTATLYKDQREVISNEKWLPNIKTTVNTEGGAEILILSRAILENGETFEKSEWLRLPDGYDANFNSGEDGADIWVKSGHLRYAVPPAV
ncbi:hypothetical protein [Sphingorhabdus sp. EL138]|uniref:hypothetical protein n=1 Tax=Sphingorhabdus sp. EL138 TaxID=2073156 RepID=UPI000D69DCD0|nr:hypothetical protein [Sphingorhabdus sp. EL138]